ncbi:GDP-L-fucose synthase [Gammaproteobacteria bacterium]|nr:GDP-L-fucose synthase [Gammaproteobacteria bacterium]
MHFKDKIYVAGHNGLVGSAIVRKLKSKGYKNIVHQSHKNLDLTNQKHVQNFFQKEAPKYVILAAAKVGGIHANNMFPADFIYDNLMIEANVIDAAYKNNCKRLLFLGSTCIYPKNAEQPILESSLLTGSLEKTNEPYAIAKIAGIKMCESYNRQFSTDFRSVMPTNLYGINDNFHPENSHVIPALMHRFHNAKIKNDKEVIVWGTGNAMREFLYVDDMAEASIFILELDKKIYDENTLPSLSHINVGTGIDISIKELAKTMKEVVEFDGKIVFDKSKPDGTPKKLTNTSRLSNMGWSPNENLFDGLTKTYEWYRNTKKNND